jgi:hypothetical protein
MTGVRDIDANGFDPYANKPKSWKRKPDGGLPQPTGTWHINAAGSSFELQIASVDFQGSGLLLGNGAVSGHLLGDEMRGL